MDALATVNVKYLVFYANSLPYKSPDDEKEKLVRRLFASDDYQDLEAAAKVHFSTNETTNAKDASAFLAKLDWIPMK